MDNTPSAHTLAYTVHNWSSYSLNYHPSNIQFDKPKDHTSRWCAISKDPQFVILKLKQLAVVTSITFGKYERQHVCNLRKFSIYGGLKQTTMSELLSGGLENDGNKETFSLHHELQGRKFPVRFIKIVPKTTYGAESNFSVWFVKLTGIDHQDFVKTQLGWFKNYKEHETIRLCLKHFRRKNYMKAFDELEKASDIRLEEPIVSELHRVLVRTGDFEAAEKMIDKAFEENLFQPYVTRQSYQAKWTHIYPMDENGAVGGCHPGPRGGHQMCIDVKQQSIMLLGGWDGWKELADFWTYNIQSGQWHCISEDMTADGGPTARSCHKICLDTKRRDLYLLGRYLDPSARADIELKSDFYKYNLDTGLWETLSLDTHEDGGPHLIFDHQMQYDPITDQIYIFGGRILTSTFDDRTLDPTFSGLFTYHVVTKSWTKLRGDSNDPNEQNPMKGRSGHSMLLDQRKRLLYIFAGQRGSKEYLSDFFSFNIDTGEIQNIACTTNSSSFPSAGFTQRATIDIQRNEIFMLSGLSREDKKEEIRNSFWVCDMSSYEWDCLYKNENEGQNYWNKMYNVEPRPRYAHQLVYDQVNKVHYLFGGNPGRSGQKIRLNDFWRLKLERKTVEGVIRHCKYMIRKLRYQELVTVDSIQALGYLQEEVSKVVDHSNKKEKEKFESLATKLFTGKTPTSSSSSSSSSDDEEEEEEDEENMNVEGDCETVIPPSVYKERSQVFDQLSLYFPAHMVQPTGNITDFISI